MHDLTPVSAQFGPHFLIALLPFIFGLILWSVVIKGFALWHSARGGQTGWFIAMLIINTLGILEIVYLLFFRPRPIAPVTPSLEKQD